MKKKLVAMLLAAVMAVGLLPGTAFAAGGSTKAVTLNPEYTFAGFVTGAKGPYAETAYRASPVVTDLDGDGRLEVINVALTLNVMDAATGALKWRVNTTKDRSTPFSTSNNFPGGEVYCDPVVLDIDGDGKKEIVIGYGNGTVSVLDNQGYFKPGWPKTPTSGSIRALVADDLDGDGKMEIIVGAGIASAESVWVYDCKGNKLDGWPQLDGVQNASNHTKAETSYYSKTAYGAGVYGNGIITGHLDNDGVKEIIILADNQYINAYHLNGTLVKASSIYNDQYGGRMWGKIPLWEDYAEEKAHKDEGWPELKGGEKRSQLYRAEVGCAAGVYTDVDGDGTYEIVVTAQMMDRTTLATKGDNSQTVDDSMYMTVYILNQDRTRYNNKALGFNWETAPNDLTHPGRIEGPLQSHYTGLTSMSGNVFPVPVCADLDGKDGYQEILFNSFDGKVHCFTLDQKGWSYTLPQTTGAVYEYATPVVCKDVNNDGKLEVIFASWLDGPNGKVPAGMKGRLYVLDCEGKELASIDLPDAYDAGLNNGVMAAPVVEDIDGDGKYEVLLNTTYYALCAFEIGEGAGGSSTTSFSDVKANDWFAEAVQWAVANNITDGTGGGKFSPEKTCSHGEIITFLWRAAGYPAPSNYEKIASLPFDKNQWYGAAALWAAELDMIDKNFQPGVSCTRAEVAAYIWIANGKPGGPDYKPRFNDGNPEDFVGGYGSAQWQGINWMKREGISDGDGKNNFNPGTTITRSEISTLLLRTYVRSARKPVS